MKLSGWNNAIVCQDAHNYNRVFQLRTGGDKITYHRFGPDLKAKGTVKTDSWYHLVAVFDGTTHELYAHLIFDGGQIDVLWENHEQALAWYNTNLGWEIGETKDWRMDYRALEGKFTSTNTGTWISAMRT